MHDCGMQCSSRQFARRLALHSAMDAVRALSPEERVRCRYWIMEAFDGCGFPRTSSPCSDVRVEYRVTDFPCIDMRQRYRAGHTAQQNITRAVGGIYAIASDSDWLYVGRATCLPLR